MDSQRLRTMMIEFLGKEGPNDYIFGKIVGIIDANIEDTKGVFMMGDSRYPNSRRLSFWADSEQYERLKRQLVRFIPTKMVKIICYEGKKLEEES